MTVVSILIILAASTFLSANVPYPPTDCFAPTTVLITTSRSHIILDGGIGPSLGISLGMLV